MNARTGVRWVGFDMDECLGSFMPLWPFVELLPEDARMSDTQLAEYLKAVASRVAENPLQLFRPGVPELVRKLKKAQQDGVIAGCFILTNNGSKELADTVRQALNHMANTTLFPVAWHRYSPCRQRSENPQKDWATIQACLRGSGLPTMSHPHDLLYYDDQEHVLKSEIPYYVLVPEYTIETPVNLVFHKLKPVFQRFGIPADMQQATLQNAVTDERKNRTTVAKGAAFPTEELDRFVGNMGIGGKHKTRRMRRMLREKTLRRRRGKKMAKN